MKLWALVFASAFFFTAPSFAQDSGGGEGVYAYYFHGTARCPTCRKIEQYSQEAVEKNFERDMEAGRVVFKALNVEDKGNEHYVQDYQLYTKALVISLVRDGKEIKWKNLARVWEFAGDKEKFEAYVRQEILSFLGGA